MFIKKIYLKNFRNFDEILINLNKNLNIFIGKNGQGKTNLLESIYLLATASSHRTNIDSEMIKWDKESSIIQVILYKKEDEIKLSLIFEGSRKIIKINENPLTRISDLVGNINVVLFSPEDLQLVKGGPFYRRKFLDVEVSQVSTYYHHLLKKYEHILKQRNNLLKDIRERRDSKKESMLDIWDKQLVDIGTKVVKKRLEVVEKLKILARLAQRQITDGSENLNIEYEFSFNGKVEKDKVNFIFNNNLVNNRNREIKRGYTLFGPHRDDLILKINGMDVRKYGSQGQQRTVALALKMAELEFMKSETGEYPLLLLDDVFSELDNERKNKLLDIISDKIQTIITTTDLKDFKSFKLDLIKLFRVVGGKIIERR